MKEIVFVTGNQSKADYLSRMVDYPFRHVAYDQPEIQSLSLEEIVEQKARAAYAIIGKAVLVEDVSLGLNEIGGLPGTFIKFWVEPNKLAGEEDTPEVRGKKLEQLCRYADTTATRVATAVCVMGYFDGERLEFMRGELSGIIADHPRGTNGFGWDAVFCPDGFEGKTRAELTPSDDTTTYATIKPFTALRDLLTSL